MPLPLYLKVLEWRQEIDCYPSINVEGLKLTAHCAPSPNSQLELRDRGDLGNFALLLDIFDEKYKQDDDRLPQEQIGAMTPRGGFVDGWLYLKSNNFAAAWDQVSIGGYVDANISLMVDPVHRDRGKFIWEVDSDRLMFINSAGLQFTRKPVVDKPVARKGWFARRAKP
jgi:hypothetical protein